MKIYSGAVIIWTHGVGKIFSSQRKADSYFDKALADNKAPYWQRIWEPNDPAQHGIKPICVLNPKTKKFIKA